MLLELRDTQACAVGEKDGADAEGALIAPTVSDVDAVRLPLSDPLFLTGTLVMANDSGDRLVQIDASGLPI